jgi:alkylated DNA repair protein alkB family protein 6
MLLERRSLILVRDDMYKVNLHGIAERKEDIISDNVVNVYKCDGVQTGDKLERTTRVSLTIRYVPKILKAKLFLGKKR